jgi:acetoin utilization deacetylase AcuC-like enzyme
MRKMLTAALLSYTTCNLILARAFSPVSVFYDASNNLHRDLQYHPEQPARIDLCVDALQSFEPAGDVELINVAEGSPSCFSDQELQHARNMLIEAHSQDFVVGLETRCRASRQKRIDEGKPGLGFVGYIDYDTYVTTETYDVCLRATAAWIRAVELAMNGSDSVALTRPPGHHATKGLANGFCIFNFAAAAAMHVLQKYPDCRISVFDWDVHYGQGVAEILQNHPRARYVSIHQLNAFPYLGEEYKVVGKHQNIMTIPIIAETTWTCGYEQAFMEKALPFLRDWQPSLIIVCAGYDALDSDELASVSLQAVDYGRMTRILRKELPSTGLMFGLEGGYQLSQNAGGGNLADAVSETLKALCIKE